MKLKKERSSYDKWYYLTKVLTGHTVSSTYSQYDGFYSNYDIEKIKITLNALDVVTHGISLMGKAILRTKIGQLSEENNFISYLLHYIIGLDPH
ncbi:hypothetical protein HUG17_0557 [Dermatophagoides farinae]|uniref:Uncharacterized protein n=1 Tax=Dermatophagoides farinae TaxID=6954 RepID=A0A9D4P7A2_DERFA|nr:hypothetical protein HUG17_0557 [Dermatophagoides farinae]